MAWWKTPWGHIQGDTIKSAVGKYADMLASNYTGIPRYIIKADPAITESEDGWEITVNWAIPRMNERTEKYAYDVDGISNAPDIDWKRGKLLGGGIRFKITKDSEISFVGDVLKNGRCPSFAEFIEENKIRDPWEWKERKYPPGKRVYEPAKIAFRECREVKTGKKGFMMFGRISYCEGNTYSSAEVGASTYDTDDWKAAFGELREEINRQILELGFNKYAVSFPGDNIYKAWNSLLIENVRSYWKYFQRFMKEGVYECFAGGILMPPKEGNS